MNRILVFFLLIAGLILTNCSNPGIFDKLAGEKDDPPPPVKPPVMPLEPNDGTSDIIDPDDTSNPDYPFITNLKASMFRFTDGISVSWDYVAAASSYKIYRYLSENDITPVELTSDVLTIFDTSAEQNVPYFYRVSCVIDDREYEKSALVSGIFGYYQDIYENNDDYSIVTSALPLDREQSAILHLIPDGLGGKIHDTDWYLYQGDARDIYVSLDLTLPNGYPDGAVKLLFYYEGQESAIHTAHALGMPDVFNFKPTAGISGTIDVYFKVYLDPTLDAGSGLIMQRYVLTISNEVL